MALFRGGDPFEEEEQAPEEYGPEEDLYDDGFDELTEEPEEELSEEEKAARKASRYRLAAGAGNLAAVIGGTVLILVLLALLFSMINFVTTDLSRNFSLFQTNF